MSGSHQVSVMGCGPSGGLIDPPWNGPLTNGERQILKAVSDMRRDVLQRLRELELSVDEAINAKTENPEHTQEAG